jgi:hypothetical protein
MKSSYWIYRSSVGASAVSAGLFLLTLVEPAWIERLFDASPDGGDGSAERWLAAAFLAASILAAGLALRTRSGALRDGRDRGARALAAARGPQDSRAPKP